MRNVVLRHGSGRSQPNRNRPDAGAHHEAGLGRHDAEFHEEEVALLEKMRANKETILRILYEEMNLATSVNARGRDKINNLIRMVEKICK
jgi:hypothetical protein